MLALFITIAKETNGGLFLYFTYVYLKLTLSDLNFHLLALNKLLK